MDKNPLKNAQNAIRKTLFSKFARSSKFAKMYRGACPDPLRGTCPFAMSRADSHPPPPQNF